MFFYSHENLCSKLQGGRILMRPPCYKSQNKFITKRKYSTCTDGITQHALKGRSNHTGRKYWVISTVQFATFSVVLT